MTDSAGSTRVSVLVPTFNRGDLLTESLDSLLGQSVSPHQIVVIDDGSTDDTATRVATYGSRVEYISKANGGKASALNLGLTRVTGDFVWVFDDDDVALPSSIADRLEVLAGRPDVGLVLARHFWGASSASGAIEVRSESTWPPVNSSNVSLTLMLGCFTMLQAALVRTSCFRAVGPFREDLLRSQDYDMLLRLVRRFPVSFLDKPTYILRRHEGVRGPAAIRHAAGEREQVWAKFDGLLGIHLRNDASLGEFLSPPSKETLNEREQRQALLNRMAVMASKGLAAEMIEDAMAFAAIGRDLVASQLTAGERATAISAVQQRYFLLNVVPQWVDFERRARDLASSRLGRAVLRAYARGLFGLARWGTRSLRDRARILRLAVGLAFTASMPRRVR